MFRQKFLSNQFAQTKLWRENKYRKKWREITTKKSLQRNLHGKSQKSSSRPTKFWRETSSKKYLKKKFLPRIFWREITAKKYVTKFSAKESLKRHSLPKAWKEESPRKKMKTCLPKSFWQFLYQELSEEKSKNFSSNLYRKSIGRNISTTNSLKGNLYKTIFKRNLYWKIFQEKIYKTNI